MSKKHHKSHVAQAQRAQQPPAAKKEHGPRAPQQEFGAQGEPKLQPAWTPPPEAKARPAAARQEEPQTALSGCLVRFLWMLVCNGVMVVSLIFIVEHEASFFSGADIVFWLVAAAAVSLRYIDIAYFKGLTASGKPADMPMWKRYTLMLAGICLAAWIIAHAIAYFRA